MPRPKKKGPLTPKLDETLGFLELYAEGHRFMPSLREIGEKFGIHPESARRRLERLADAGYIRVRAGKARAIKLL